MTTDRLIHFDALRGFTMILVVYSHFFLLLYGGTRISEMSFYSPLFSAFRMPLFFFISGFFVYCTDFDRNKFRIRSYNRLLRQLFPTLVFAILFNLIVVKLGPLHFLSEEPKTGYWFTWVLVEFFFLVTPILLIFSSRKVNKTAQSILLSAVALLVWMVPLVCSPEKGTFLNTFFRYVSMGFAAKNFPFFIMGILVRMNYPTLARHMHTRRFALLASAAFGASFALLDTTRTGMLIMGVTGALAIYSIGYQLFTPPGSLTVCIARY